MVDIRPNALSYFSFPELFVLYGGKVIPALRSKKFSLLQDKQNKLAIVHKNGKILSVENDEVSVELKILQRDLNLFLRVGGSDVWVFNQVMVLREYDYVLSLFEEHFKQKPQTLIDAGANIGLTSLFFSAANEGIRIVSIEADHENYKRALRNINANNLNSIVLKQLALWSSNTNLEIVNDFRDKQEWSLRVRENKDGFIRSITPQEAITLLGENVDVFKIDIEGGEYEILNSKNNLEWLRKVKVIALEIHEEYGSAEKIISVLTKYGFTLHHRGELTVGINEALLK